MNTFNIKLYQGQTLKFNPGFKWTLPTVVVGGTPDPLQLPLVSTSTQLTQSHIDTYQSLEVHLQSASYTYTDPAGTATIIKLTAALNYPVAHENARFDYALGGPYISQVWDNDNVTVFIMVDPAGAETTSHWLLDVNLSTGTVSNARKFTPTEQTTGDVQTAFSYKAGEERIMYYSNGSGVIERWDTETDAAANTGNWPHTFTGYNGKWLGNEINSRYFCMVNESSNATAFKIWDEALDSEVTKTIDLDSITLDRGSGNYAFVNLRGGASASYSRGYNRLTDTFLATTSEPCGDHQETVGQSGYAVFRDTNTGDIWKYDLNSGSSSLVYDISELSYTTNLPDYVSGQWAIDNLPGTASWFIGQQDGWDGTLGDISSNTSAAVWFLSLDGKDYRHFFHPYNVNGARVYFQRFHASLSADGRCVGFASDMHSSGSALEAFIAVVPTS